MSKNQKKIWITGASSGIGKAVAEKFASEGWKVAISARREDLLNKISEKENIFSFPCDVTSSTQINNTFKKIMEEFKSIDICLFSTGTYDPKQEQNIDIEKIENVMDVNFMGIVKCVKAVEDYFKNKRSGQISVVSSIAGYRGLPNSSGYGPSKAALTNFAESIYFDFKKFNVRVSLITPGFIKTALTDKNDFKMPFLKDTTYAANEIYNGLVNKNNFEIIFPLPIKIIYKLIQILPNRLYNYLISKSVNR